MRRRTLNNLKIATVYASALFLCHTLRTVPDVCAEDAPKRVVHNFVHTTVENKMPETESETETLAYALSEDDTYRLAKIAMAEAESEDVEGKALVVLTVLNRIESDDFGDSVEEVIFAPGQFDTTLDEGRYWNYEPDQESYDAVEMVVNGWDESEGCLYFENINTVSWMDANASYLFTHGDHKFYR